VFLTLGGKVSKTSPLGHSDVLQEGLTELADRTTIERIRVRGRGGGPECGNLRE